MYVVTGVSGNTGSVVAETLLSQKKAVRVVVRDAAKGAPWKARGAEVAVADLRDVPALTEALRGAEGAYLLSPPDLKAKDMLAEFAERTIGVAKAVSEAKVPHVVYLSSAGAQHAEGTGPIRSTHFGEMKLAAAAPRATFVRAAYFMENWASSLGGIEAGVFPSFLAPDLRVPMVATKDIGRTAAHALVEGTPGVIELSGPRDYTAREVAKALSGIVGKELTVQQGPEEAIVPALMSFGFSASVAGLFQEMIHGINTGHVAWEGGAAKSVRGTVAIEEVLRGLLGK